MFYGPRQQRHSKLIRLLASANMAYRFTQIQMYLKIYYPDINNTIKIYNLILVASDVTIINHCIFLRAVLSVRQRPFDTQGS